MNTQRLGRYAARCANSVLVVTRRAVPGARSAPRDTGNQPTALSGYQGTEPLTGYDCGTLFCVEGAIVVAAHARA